MTQQNFATALARLAKTSAALALLGAASMTAVQAETKSEEPQIEVGRSLSGNYLAARIANTDKDTESASQFFRGAMALDPDNVELKQRAFQTFIANGNFDEGVSLGKQLTQANMAPEMASIILAVDRIRAKEWTAAERELSKDWRSALDRLLAGLVLGWAQAGDNRPEEALATVDALTGPAWFDLFVDYHGGLIALHSGDSNGAIQRLTKAFDNRAAGRAATVTYMRVVQALAVAHWKAGNREKAKEMADHAIAAQPQNPVFEEMHARVVSGQGLNNPFTSAQRGAAEVFLNLGTAINRDGGEDFARVYLQLANVLASKDETIMIQLADLYDQQNLMLRANALFAKIPPESPYFRTAQLEVAINLDALDRFDEAQSILDSLIKTAPDDLTTHLAYGAVLARHEKFAEAIPVYTSLIERLEQPERYHWSLFYRQGIAYERTKQWEKAEVAFNKALELYPDEPNVLNYLGYSWIDMGINLEKGLELVQRAVDIRPNDGYIVDSLGWAYYRLGDYDKAVEHLERAVSLRPGDPTINDHLGDAYWMADRKLEATFQWRQALALEPPSEEEAKAILDKLENGFKEPSPRLAKPEETKPDNG
ncbi:tetratricopeptide repeat protein [Pseudahrensia aquimaris]|uniref:Tetratricopeptide repeat protein n=1 Tax=Pseudahrensia aquimaris TaxID=744461 RepID=A0ABW3FC12_9HYPH